MSELEVLKCLNCGGAVDPTQDKCPYCGYYNGHYYRNKDKPKPKPEPEPETRSNEGYRSHSSGSGLRSVVYFTVLLMMVSILGTTFTNGTIQADFTAAAVMASSLLGIILFLAAVNLMKV